MLIKLCGLFVFRIDEYPRAPDYLGGNPSPIHGIGE